MGWILLVLFIVISTMMFASIFKVEKKIKNYNENEPKYWNEQKKSIKQLYIYTVILIIIAFLIIVVSMIF